jgi:hypothetical protein
MLKYQRIKIPYLLQIDDVHQSAGCNVMVVPVEELRDMKAFWIMVEGIIVWRAATDK